MCPPIFLTPSAPGGGQFDPLPSDKLDLDVPSNRVKTSRESSRSEPGHSLGGRRVLLLEGYDSSMAKQSHDSGRDVV